MALLSTSISFARNITNTNNVSAPDAACIAYASDSLLELRKQFILQGVAAGQIQEAYFTPTASIGQYNYPSNLLMLKAIEVNLTDTTQTDYIQATKYDVSNSPMQYSFDYMRVNQPVQQPLFNDSGSFFEIFPTPLATMSLTNAIKIIYYVAPTLYATTGDTLAWPEALDTGLLGYGIGERILRAAFKKQPADDMHTEFAKKITDTVSFLSMQSNMPTTPQSVPLTGAEF